MTLWGLYGDLLHEPFDWKKVLRSIFLGVIYSVYLFLIDASLPLIVVIFMVIAFERITTEIFKASIRQESQSKYKIPSDLNIHLPRSIKIPIGMSLILLVPLSLPFISFHIDYFLLLFIAMFLPALGGMLKDAPFEGFQLLKFFRTPVFVLSLFLYLVYFFPNLEQKYLLLALWGGERILSECYKKIINSHSPGKFKQDNLHPISKSWKSRRKFLLLPYIFNLILIFGIAYYSSIYY